MRVLNVGGGASRDIPKIFKGWDQDLLDADASVNPDICCDAKQMNTLPASKYDAVFCSHTLEHFYRHDVDWVLRGFRHVLKRDGFANVIVPDMMTLIKRMNESGADIGDVWYHASGSAITFHDVMYGWHRMMESGNLYYAHKCGFSQKTLNAALRRAGFASVRTASDGMGNLFAFAFKSKPSAEKLRRLGC